MLLYGVVALLLKFHDGMASAWLNVILFFHGFFFYKLFMRNESFRLLIHVRDVLLYKDKYLGGQIRNNGILSPEICIFVRAYG